LADERSWTHDQQASNETLREQGPQNEARLDRFAEANVIRNKPSGRPSGYNAATYPELMW
jgi:hypothetical protein